MEEKIVKKPKKRIVALLFTLVFTLAMITFVSNKKTGSFYTLGFVSKRPNLLLFYQLKISHCVNLSWQNTPLCSGRQSRKSLKWAAPIPQFATRE